MRKETWQERIERLRDPRECDCGHLHYTGDDDGGPGGCKAHDARPFPCYCDEWYREVDIQAIDGGPTLRGTLRP